MVKKAQQYYVFLETVEKSWHLTNYSQTILVCCHRKCLDSLHHCVVWSQLLQGESLAGNTCEMRIQNNLGLGCQPLNRSITFGVCENRRTLSALDISTGPLARRTFQTAGPVHFICHWPVRATQIYVGPPDFK